MNPRLLLAAALLAAATFSLAAPSPRPQQQPQVLAHPRVDAKDKVYPSTVRVDHANYDANAEALRADAVRGDFANLGVGWNLRKCGDARKNQSDDERSEAAADHNSPFWQ